MGLKGGGASVRKEQDSARDSGGDGGSGEERKKAVGAESPKAVLETL